MRVLRFSTLPVAELPLVGDEAAIVIQHGATCQTPLNTMVILQSYTVGSLPDATTAGQLIYVSNEVGGAVPAFSSGGQWLRVTDRAVVS